MQKKLLIPILVVLVLVIVLMVRGCGNKDASQGDKQDETQDVQTDTFDNTNTTGNDVRTELGTMTANESGGVDITVTADGPQTTYTYTDVAPDAWYADAVNWAAARGIVKGYDTGAFGPEDSVTREQLAAILYRYAQAKGYDTTQGGMAVREFSDYDSISDWAGQSMTWAVNAGILSGRGNNTLAPTAGATRAEMAVMLQQFVGLMEK